MFAEGTGVAVIKSKGEIEKTLKKYKATGFGFAENNGKACVQFQMFNRQVQYMFEIPVYGKHKIRRRNWDHVASAKQCEDEERRLWRTVAWSIKLKLECVESKVTSFENEFMAHIVLPDGKTVSESIAPAIAEAYTTGKVQPMLGWRS